MLLPVGRPADDRFACTLCGKCCETLKEKPGAPEHPAGFDALARHGWYGLATERGLQAWAWEARRMAAEARAKGRDLRVVPSTVLLDDSTPTGRVVTLVYELDHMMCPLRETGPVPDSVVCGAYDARPLVCRAFPVVARAGGAAYSVKCPSAFAPPGPDRAGYVDAYGDAFLAAEAGGRVVAGVRQLLDFLETTGRVKLRRGATREEVARRVARGPVVDFWDALGEADAIDRDAWLARLREAAPFTPHV